MAGKPECQRPIDGNIKGNLPKTSLAVRLALDALGRPKPTKVNWTATPVPYLDSLYRLQIVDSREAAFFTLTLDLIGNAEVLFDMPRMQIRCCRNPVPASCGQFTTNLMATNTFRQLITQIDPASSRVIMLISFLVPSLLCRISRYQAHCRFYVSQSHSIKYLEFLCAIVGVVVDGFDTQRQSST